MSQFSIKCWILCLLATTNVGCSKSTSDEVNTATGTAIVSVLSRSSSTKPPKGTFAQVSPDYNIIFPKDHASHPEFAVEWWYVTANLKDKQNKNYALQWTLFRFATESELTPWSNNQQYMAHVGLRDGQKSWFEERFARGGVGNAQVIKSPFQAFLDEWQWKGDSEKIFPSTLELTIDDEVKASLTLISDSAFILHGERGYSPKLRDGSQASYYYSQPNIDVSGELNLPGGRVAVSGKAWFDHEWTSQYFDSQTLGWDWFSIHFDNGNKLMLFNMRHKQANDFWSGTLVTKEGEQTHLTEQDIRATLISYNDVEEHRIPLHWSFRLPKYDINIEVKPMQINQWNPGIFSYYEGGTIVSGSHKGVGFIELTGY